MKRARARGTRAQIPSAADRPKCSPRQDRRRVFAAIFARFRRVFTFEAGKMQAAPVRGAK